MAAVAGAIFFLSVLGFALWSIVASVRPQLGRIAFLLRYEPAIGAELPQRARITSRGCPAPVRLAPHRLRAAA
jgi:hypothetical protein